MRLASVVRVCVLAVLIGFGVLAATGPAVAQDRAELARGNPDDPIVVGVYGDSLAEGLWGGIYRKLQRERGWSILRRARHSTGFSRSSYFDWHAAIGDHLAQDRPDLAVVAIGLNDMQAFFMGGRRNVAFGSEAWIEAYADAVRRFAGRFEEAGVPLIWIGLPAMRPGNYADQMLFINGIFEEVIAETSATFVPLYPLTIDEEGAYNAYLPDAEGRNRLVRANDGIHFTSRGYDMMAEPIFEAMLDVLAAAQAQPVGIGVPETASAPGDGPGAPIQIVPGPLR